MAFGGCSFTWGQGLHYYSALDSIVPDTAYGYNSQNHNSVHHLFREKWRWVSQVANYFNTVALTHHRNGGANDQIVEYWNACFKSHEPVPVKSFDKLSSHDYSRPIKYSDVGHFVFQFTHWMRSSFPLNISGRVKMFDTFEASDVNRPDYMSALEEFIDSLDIAVSPNNTKLGEFHLSLIKRDVAQVKELLMTLESNGIKTYVIAWPWEHVEYIKADSWLSERFITFDYAGKNYRCLEDLIKEGGPGLDIETDFDFFDIPPKDGHPSLKCNRIIAENVIKFIEDKNNIEATSK